MQWFQSGRGCHSCLAGAASSIAISLTCSGNNRFRCGKLIHSFSQEKRTKLIQILCSDLNVARFAIACMVGTTWVRRPIACISCWMESELHGHLKRRSAVVLDLTGAGHHHHTARDASNWSSSPERMNELTTSKSVVAATSQAYSDGTCSPC